MADDVLVDPSIFEKFKNAQPEPDPGTERVDSSIFDKYKPKMPNEMLKAVGGSVADPDKAAEAVKLSGQTGVPATVANDNPEFVKDQKKAKDTTEAVEQSQAVRDYINSHPLAASASNDDWSVLSSIDKWLQNNTAQKGELFDKFSTAFAERLGTDEFGISYENLKKYPSWMIFQPIAAAADALMRGTAATVSGVAASGAAWAKQAGILSEGTETQGRNEIENLLNYVMYDKLARHGEVHTPQPIRVGDAYRLGATNNLSPVSQFLTKAYEAGIRQEFAKRAAETEKAKNLGDAMRTAAKLHEEAFGERPLALPSPEMLSKLEATDVGGTGVDPVADALKIKRAETNAETLDQAISLSKESKTAERSPELYAKFLEASRPGEIVSIPLEAVDNLYPPGEVPSPGDGRLGFIKDLPQRIEIARRYGGDIEVPRSDYIAYGDEVHEKIKEDLRHNDTDPTLNEAKMMEENTAHTYEDLTDDVQKEVKAKEAQVAELPKAEEEEPPKKIIPAKERAEFEKTFRIEPKKLSKTDERLVNVNENIDSLVSKVTKKFPTIGKQLGDIATAVRAANDTGIDIDATVAGLDKALKLVKENVGESDLTKRLEKMLDDVSELEARPDVEAGARGVELGELHEYYLERVKDADKKSLVDAKSELEKINRTLAAHTGLEGPGDRQLRAMQMAYQDVIKSKEVAPIAVTSKDFKVLGQMQRGAPEQAMLDVQHTMGGGVLSPVVEHAGDLVHRMTNLAEYGNAGYDDVKPKVERVIRILEHPYGFEKEMQENIRDNADYRGADINEMRKDIDSKLAKFAEEHAKLPAYNDAQRLAQQINLAIGNKKWDDAIAGLKEMQKHLTDRKTWEAFAFENMSEAPPVEGMIEPVKPDAEQKAALKDPNGVKAAETTKKVAKAERKALYLDPLFKDEKTLGLTKAEYKGYSNKIEAQQKGIDEKALAAAVREVKRRHGTEWNNNEKEMQLEVSNDFEHDLRFVADTYFRTGKSPGDVLDKGLKLTDENADAIADALGYQTADAMKKSMTDIDNARKAAGLKPAEYAKREFNAEVTRRMEQRYGALYNEIIDDAREMALHEAQLDILTIELKGLARQSGQKPLTKEDLARQVETDFGPMSAKEGMKYEKMIAQAGRAGNKTQQILLKGDTAAAFLFKQQQIRSMMLAKQAKVFAREMRQLNNIHERFSEPIVPSVAQEYTNHIQGMMERVGEPTKRDQADLPTQTDFEQFMAQKRAEYRMVIDPNLPNKNSLAEFTVDEIRDYKASIDSLIKNGRSEKNIEILGKLHAYEDAVAEVLQNLDALKKKNFDPTAKGPVSAARYGARALDAQLIKMERLFDWIDRYDPNGVMNSAVFRPLTEAKNWKTDKMREIGKTMKGLDQGRAWRKSLSKPVENTTLLDADGMKPMELNRGNLLVIAANMGTESSRAKLLGGYRWDEADVLDMLKKELTDKDWNFVKGVWGIFKEKLGPDMRRVTEKLSGVPIVLEKGIDVAGQAGEYYPLIEDPLHKLYREKAIIEDDGPYSALPNARATKRRTGAVYPIDLDFTRLPNRIDETVHNLAYREAMINARKILSDPLIRSGIGEAFGPEYVEKINDWLEHIATNGGSRDLKSEALWRRLSAGLRTNTIATMVGYNVGTPLIHGGSALFNSMNEAGLRPFVIESFNLLTKHQGQWFDYARRAEEESGELRNRNHDFDVDLQRQASKALGQHGIGNVRASMIQMSTYAIKFLDKLSTYPVYYAIKNKAIAEGASEEDAIYMAGKAIRNAHGNSGLIDTSAIQRTSEGMRWATMFYGYFNHNYNQIRDFERQMFGKGGPAGSTFGDKFMTAVGFSIAYIIAPAIVHGMIRHTPNPEDDDFSASVWLLEAMGGQIAGTVPGARELYQIVYGHTPTPSPVVDVARSVHLALRDAYRMWDGDKPPSKKAIQHFIEAFGFATGISPRQIGKSIQFLWDTKTGEQEPDGIGQWLRGIGTGQAEKKGK